jgi:predicted nucleic-acid-binding protein
MIGIDTNVLVRYIVQDDPEQSTCATRIIEKAVDSGKTIVISQITLCELVWVLEKCYNCSKNDLTYVLKQLLRTQQIRIEGDQAARQALQDFERHKGIDFSDCLIAHQNTSNGCLYTFTFDKKAAKQLPSIFKIL